MIPPNVDRNQRVYRVWESRYTIDQAAAELPDIPRSTIGYYYRKFNQYAKEGRPIVLPQSSQKPNKETLLHAAIKVYDLNWALETVRSGRAEYAYHALGILRLMKDLNLFVTPEEAKAFLENMAEAITAFLNIRTQTQTTTPLPDASEKGRTLEECTQEIKKRREEANENLRRQLEGSR